MGVKTLQGQVSSAVWDRPKSLIRACANLRDVFIVRWIYLAMVLSAGASKKRTMSTSSACSDYSDTSSVTRGLERTSLQSRTPPSVPNHRIYLNGSRHGEALYYRPLHTWGAGVASFDKLGRSGRVLTRVLFQWFRWNSGAPLLLCLGFGCDMRVLLSKAWAKVEDSFVVQNTHGVASTNIFFTIFRWICGSRSVLSNLRENGFSFVGKQPGSRNSAGQPLPVSASARR